MTRGKATVRRASNETSIFVDLDLGGKGRFAGSLGDPLLTHLLETFVRYAGIDLRIEAKGDETHHVAEDVAHTGGRAPRKGLPAPGGGRVGGGRGARGEETHHVAEAVPHTVGRALRKALPAAGVARFGEALVPMDEALVQVAVDLVDRPYYRSDLPASSMAEHVLRSLVSEARLTFHEVTLRPGEDHP